MAKNARNGFLTFGLYEQACVGLSYGSTVLWRDPADERLSSNGFPFWLNLAKIAEEANMDFLFFGDVLGMTDTYQHSARIAIETGKELPAHDPFMIAPAILAATQHLGVVVTASTTYEHPFSLARRFSTLDHLSQGRIGWNIVTSYTPSAASNFGHDQMMDHDVRYDRADEFLDVTMKLWEGSWADDSFVGDRSTGIFAHGDRVRTIDHQGDLFQVRGPHLSHPSPQRTPLLFQAGWSPRGRQFAARHTEVLFAGSQPATIMAEGIDDVRRQAAALGRDPAELRFLAAFSVVTAPTAAEVQNKFDRLQRLHETGYESRLAEYAGWSGIDLTRLADDELVGPGDQTRIQHGTPTAAPTAGEVKATLRRLGADSPNVFIGTPDTVTDQIEAYATASGVDGLVLRSFVSPGSLEDFTQHIVPRLIERGLYRDKPSRTSLRENVTSSGRAHLGPSYLSMPYRW